MTVVGDLFRAWLDQYFGSNWHALSHVELERVKAAYLAGYADAHTEMRQHSTTMDA